PPLAAIPGQVAAEVNEIGKRANDCQGRDKDQSPPLPEQDCGDNNTSWRGHKAGEVNVTGGNEGQRGGQPSSPEEEPDRPRCADENPAGGRADRAGARRQPAPGEERDRKKRGPATATPAGEENHRESCDDPLQ